MDHRQTWLAERRRRIQSTDAAALCGLAPETWRVSTPLAVYADKLGLLPDEDNTAMKSGRLLEGVVAAMYEEETGRTLHDPEGAICTHPQRNWQGATLDRLTADGQRVVELKTTRWAERGEEGWGEPGTDQIPPHYLCQVQHQLAVTGLPVADVALLVGGQELRIFTVERSEAFIDRLNQIEAEFWSLIQHRREPEPDWRHPATPGLLDLIRRPVAGKVIEIDDLDVLTLAFEYRQMAETIRDAEKRKNQIKADLLHALGDAETAQFPEGTSIVRKTVKRKAYDVKACEYVTLTVKESN